MALIEEKAAELTALREASREAEVSMLERSAQYRLSDAIREGAQVSGQAYAWTDKNENLCALSAAVVAAKSRNYL